VQLFQNRILSAPDFQSSLRDRSDQLKALHKAGSIERFNTEALDFINAARDSDKPLSSLYSSRLWGNLLFILKNTTDTRIHQAILNLLNRSFATQVSPTLSSPRANYAFYAPAITEILHNTLGDSSELQSFENWAEKQAQLRNWYSLIRDKATSSQETTRWQPLSIPGYQFIQREKNRLRYIYLARDETLRQSLLDNLNASNDTGLKVSFLATGEAPPAQTANQLVRILDDLIPGTRICMVVDKKATLGASYGRQRWFMLASGTLIILFILFIGAWVLTSLSNQIKLNRLKNDFIGTVTHELKTPLASTRLLVDTLIDSPLENKERIRRYLEQISRSNERLSILIENFLTFSRMERGKVQLSYDAVDPVDIAKQALESVQPYLDEAQCELTFNAPDHMPACRANPEALVTILVNFLSNACKYSVDDKRIILAITEQDDSIHFSVSDHGLGIPRHQQKRIFDRFYQIDRKLSRKAEGSGLGLSIVKYLIDAHQGKVFLESTPGEGSTFTAAIPKA